MAEEQAQSKQVRSKQRRLAAVEETSGPQLSYWPFVLAVALMIAFVGIVIHPILLGIGVVLTAVAVIGWGLERR
ncbi:MAG TPA: cytochrome c oxidase subunit 4 [Ktedonobacteraceae bacterium]|nr:cytochrome c oxidase subunit 4 [Ktedonobacteraceae bacterium]